MRLTKVTKAELKEYAVKHGWEYQMSRSQGLDSFSNYAGENFGDLVVVIGRNRDSEILEESNFECALSMLGGESTHVQVTRSNHWACGWIELIMVNPKSSKHLKIAYDIHKSLKDYPVLDDMDFSEREYEQNHEYAEGAKEELAEALSKHFGVRNSKQLERIAYELNIANQQYYGNDSCVNVYTGRKPDKTDIKELEVCLKEIEEYSFKSSVVFKRLVKAVSEYQIAAVA